MILMTVAHMSLTAMTVPLIAPTARNSKHQGRRHVRNVHTGRTDVTEAGDGEAGTPVIAASVVIAALRVSAASNPGKALNSWIARITMSAATLAAMGVGAAGHAGYLLEPRGVTVHRSRPGRLLVRQLQLKVP